MAGTTPLNGLGDGAGMAQLKVGAKAQDPKALREAARQFEVMFTQMLLKTAHGDSSPNDGLGGPEADTWRALHDQQMAQQISSGRGLGIAEMLVRQLQAKAMAGAPAGSAATAAREPAASALPPLQAAANPARSASDPSSDAPRNFVEKLAPHAEAAAAELGVPAKVILAQAALETGWGRHVPTQADGSPSHNYFGIKADASWTGPTVSRTTTEYVDGRPRSETAKFRAYATPAEGVADYVRFVRENPRYASALQHGGDGAQYAAGLQKAGYATDPAYASKIARIAYGRSMQSAFADPASRSA